MMSIIPMSAWTHSILGWLWDVMRVSQHCPLPGTEGQEEAWAPDTSPKLGKRLDKCEQELCGVIGFQEAFPLLSHLGAGVKGQLGQHFSPHAEGMPEHQATL